MVFSPRETMIERAILPDEVYEGVIEGEVLAGKNIEKSSGSGGSLKKDEDGLMIV